MRTSSWDYDFGGGVGRVPPWNLAGDLLHCLHWLDFAACDLKLT